jgi:hypothetical protein
MNTACTTYAKVKGGGTMSAWFDTPKIKIDDELKQEFLILFPEIERLKSIDLFTKNINPKTGTVDRLDYWKDW